LKETKLVNPQTTVAQIPNDFPFLLAGINFHQREE